MKQRLFTRALLVICLTTGTTAFPMAATVSLLAAAACTILGYKHVKLSRTVTTMQRTPPVATLSQQDRATLDAVNQHCAPENATEGVLAPLGRVMTWFGANNTVLGQVIDRFNGRNDRQQPKNLARAQQVTLAVQQAVNPVVARVGNLERDAATKQEVAAQIASALQTFEQRHINFLQEQVKQIPALRGEVDALKQQVTTLVGTQMKEFSERLAAVEKMHAHDAHEAIFERAKRDAQLLVEGLTPRFEKVEAFGDRITTLESHGNITGTFATAQELREATAELKRDAAEKNNAFSRDLSTLGGRVAALEQPTK